jgi:glycerol-3-phosphate acyltransferase PlsX
MSLTIALDGMGGDRAPEIVVDGAALTLGRQPDLSFRLYGDEARIGPLLAALPGAAGRGDAAPHARLGGLDAKPSVALRRAATRACGSPSTR